MNTTNGITVIGGVSGAALLALASVPGAQTQDAATAVARNNLASVASVRGLGTDSASSFSAGVDAIEHLLGGNASGAPSHRINAIA